MGIGQNAFIFSIILSLCLYVGGVRVFEQDALSKFFDMSDENNPKLSGELNSELPADPYSSGAQKDISFGIIDGLFLVYDIIKMLLNVIIAPIGLLVGILPTPFVILIGIPLAMFNVLGIISLVRGSIGW